MGHDMTDNTRIRTNELGVRIERIATETKINYEPVSQNAQILFRGVEYMTTADGVSVESIGNEQYLAVSLADIAAKTYNAGTDPVTGTDLSQVSPAGIALIIKSVYDTEHNDTYAPAAESETAGSANE